MLQPGVTVVAACSGGADSLALTHALAQVAAEVHFVVCVCHVQHHLRGVEAERDAGTVKAFAAAYRLPYKQLEVNVPELVAREGLSVEEAARKLRYAALETCRQQVQAVAIFLAHQRDDQAETVLLNLVRGAGTRGVRGMLPYNKYLVRPFLTVSRQEIEDYCRQYDLTYCLDSTNEDVQYKRNWVRKRLVPLLHTLNPQINKQLAQTAALAACDEDCLEQQAAAYLQCFGRQVFEYYDVAAGEDFSALHQAVQTRVIRQMLQKAGGREISYEHIQAVLALLNKGVGGKAVDVPGVRIMYANGRLLAGRPEKSRQQERKEKIQQKERQRHAGKLREGSDRGKCVKTEN